MTINDLKTGMIVQLKDDCDDYYVVYKDATYNDALVFCANWKQLKGY